LVGSILRSFLEIVEGASLLRSRLNNLFNALHWQVDETASADARSRQYLSYCAVFSARDPGDVARKSVFGMFRPVMRF
jgi:hypothetical protein